MPTEQKQPERRVAKHLIDPANPRPRRRPEERERDLEKLTRVKQWVTSALLVTTMIHFSVGLMIAAMAIDDDRVDARIGLNVIGGILLVAGGVGARLIHAKKPISLWLVPCVLPMFLGLWLTFR